MPFPGNRRSRAVALFMSLLGLTTYALVAVGAVALTPAPAHAHAGLTGSDPEADSTVEQMPSEVVLTFNERITEPAYVVVRTPDGTTYEDGLPVVEENTVTQAVVDSGTTGRHIIAYRVVSADGHPVMGEFEFTVEGDGTQPEPSATPSAGSDTDAPAATSDSADESSADGFLQRYGTGIGVAVGAVVLAGLALVLRRRRTP